MGTNKEKKTICFIVNPVSGSRRNEKIEHTIRKTIDGTSFLPSFYYTEYRGHAAKLAQQLIAKDIKDIVAVGGDGTINEVASQLVNRDVNFGIVPAGSGNGLARHLKIPLKTEAAVSRLNEQNLKKIDAGRINEHYFFCTCGVGFDAKVGHLFAKSHYRGFWSYLKIVVKHYKKYKPKKYNIKIDGEKHKIRAFMISVANAEQFGNNAFIAPGADISDGKLNVTIIRSFPFANAFNLGIMLFTQKIHNSTYCDTFLAENVVFKKRKKKYLFHYDGEPDKIKGKKISISILPKALKVYC